MLSLDHHAQHGRLGSAVLVSALVHVVLLFASTKIIFQPERSSASLRPPLNAVLVRPAQPSPASNNPDLLEAQSDEQSKIDKPPEPASAADQRQASNSAQAAVKAPFSALYYYTVPELDQRPQLRSNITLSNAPDTASGAVNGKAVLELLIEQTGQINAVNIVRTDLPASYTDNLIAAFSMARYTAGIKNLMPVRARIYIEVVYVDGVLNSLPEELVVLRPSEAHAPIPAERPADRYKRHKAQ